MQFAEAGRFHNTDVNFDLHSNPPAVLVTSAQRRIQLVTLINVLLVFLSNKKQGENRDWCYS